MGERRGLVGFKLAALDKRRGKRTIWREGAAPGDTEEWPVWDFVRAAPLAPEQLLAQGGVEELASEPTAPLFPTLFHDLPGA